MRRLPTVAHRAKVGSSKKAVSFGWQANAKVRARAAPKLGRSEGVQGAATFLEQLPPHVAAGNEA